MSNSPYRGLPSFAWWGDGVVEGDERHSIATAKFKIDHDTKIATVRQLLRAAAPFSGSGRPVGLDRWLRKAVAAQNVAELFSHSS